MSNIESQKITKPIQLLSAWLVGLISINGSFLYCATKIQGWESSALVIAAIVNVPIFIIALFILQTKFRPELQEDAFYSKYLDSKTNKKVTINKLDLIEKDVETIKLSIENKAINEFTQDNGEWCKISINDFLPNFKEIRQYLKDNKIPLNGIFGAINKTDTAPKNKIVAIDNNLSFQQKLKILKLAIEFNMDGYGDFDAELEGSDEVVLFGAYGYNSKNYIRITEDLKGLLADSPEPADLKLYESKNESLYRTRSLFD